MHQVMSQGEIQSLFQSEWVLLEDPETTETLEITGGKVLCHSKDRDEVYHKAKELKPEHSAILYTGELPEEMVVVI